MKPDADLEGINPRSVARTLTESLGRIELAKMTSEERLALMFGLNRHPDPRSDLADVAGLDKDCATFPASSAIGIPFTHSHVPILVRRSYSDAAMTEFIGQNITRLNVPSGVTLRLSARILRQRPIL